MSARKKSNCGQMSWANNDRNHLKKVPTEAPRTTQWADHRSLFALLGPCAPMQTVC